MNTDSVQSLDLLEGSFLISVVHNQTNDIVITEKYKDEFKGPS